MEEKPLTESELQEMDPTDLYLISISRNFQEIQFLVDATENVQERFNEILQAILDFEKDEPYAPICFDSSIKFEAIAASLISEEELRYLFRNHPAILKAMGLFPLHEPEKYKYLEYDSAPTFYILEVELEQKEKEVIFFSSEYYERDVFYIEDAITSNRLKSIRPVLENSFKILYREAIIMDDEETAQCFSKYVEEFNKTQTLRVI